MKYGIAIKPNYYQPEIQGRDAVTWVVENENDYNQDPKLFDTPQEAQDHIDNELIGDGPYYLAHNEAGRPDYWITTEDAIYQVQSCHQDNGLYTWPDDCDQWECGDKKGNVCGECKQCLAFMESADYSILKSAEIEL
jgi:hypothetical protein